MIKKRQVFKSDCFRLAVIAVCLFSLLACSSGGGGGGGDSSTLPATNVSGNLAQGYVRNGIIIADKLTAGSLTGNFVLDDDEETTVSDADGYFSIEIPAGYGDYVLYTESGYVLDSSGNEVPAIPMLAPAGAKNITPVTTLVVMKPELKDQIGQDFDADIADPDGVGGDILQLAQIVEALVEVFTAEDNLLVSDVADQFNIVGHLADALDGKDLTLDDSLVAACQTSMDNILEDENIIDSEKVAVTDPMAFAAAVDTAIQSVVDAIDETDDMVVESEVLADIEEAVETASDDVQTAVEKQLSITYSFLQHRNYNDDHSDKYQGWIEFIKGNDPIEASDVSAIAIKDDSGTDLDAIVSSLNAAEYYFGNYNSVSGGFDFAGPYAYAGYSIKLPAGHDLAAGDYTFEITPAVGDVMTQTVSFPETQEAPVVDSTLMTYSWSEGALTLSWTIPEGTFDNFQVVLVGKDNKELLYVKAPKTVTSVTIPEDWVERLETHSPVENWLWQLQTRAYTSDGMNHARSYSRKCKIYPAGEEADYYISWSRLQYRTRNNSDNNGHGSGLIVLKTDGTLVDEADVTAIELKNPDGNVITSEGGYFGKDPVFVARVYEGSSSLFDKGNDLISYFGPPLLPDITDFPAGNYIYEVTTADGSLLTSTAAYPGDTVLPVPDTSAMIYQWLGDGSLKLTWENPAGNYEQIKLAASDQDWRELFRITTPPSATTVTLPKWAVDEITAIHGDVPTSAQWHIQTRTYGDSGFDYARGQSDSVEIPWPQN